MHEALADCGVPVEFAERTDDGVFVGYRTHKVVATKLFTELRVVVEAVVERAPGQPVTGATFHTDRPVVGLWTVDAERSERRAAGDLSELALAVHVLHSLDTVSFG